MAIRVAEDATVEKVVGPADEEVWLPGVFPGSEEDGPIPFTFPRLGKFLSAQRRSSGLDMADKITVMTDAQTKWLADGFGPEVWEYIVGRMDAEDDQLDDGHIQWLFEQLIAVRTGRPTTSSSGAQRRRWESKPTGAPSPQASASPSSTPSSSAT